MLDLSICLFFLAKIGFIRIECDSRADFMTMEASLSVWCKIIEKHGKRI